MVLKHTGQSSPLEQTGERQFYALIETSGSNKDHDDAKLEGLLEYLLESGIVSDGVLAQDATQVGSLWQLREGIPEAAGKLGKTYKYDVSLPVSGMYGPSAVRSSSLTAQTSSSTRVSGCARPVSRKRFISASATATSATATCSASSRPRLR